MPLTSDDKTIRAPDPDFPKTNPTRNRNRTLRALDACYGTAWMQRRGRRLELTPAGEKVYHYVRLVLDHQDALLDELASLWVEKNSLRLEATFAIGEHLLPDLLMRFDEAYPQYRVESRMGYARRIRTRLATGLADHALLEQAPEHPDILVQKWLEDELVLVCGPTHSLWGAGPLSIGEVIKLRYVLRESQSSMRIVLDKALRQYGIEKLPVAMEVGSTDTIIEMLERGKHVSFLPRFAVLDAITAKALHHVKIEGLRIPRTMWIALNRAVGKNKAVDAFVKLLKKKPRNIA